MTANVAIRLGTEGKARVVGDFAEIADAGDRTAQRWQRSFERAGADVEAAIKRQANAAARLAAAQPQTPTQQAFQAAASTNYSGQSARESAEAFREAAAQQAQLEARTRALLTAIDPTLAAQHRLNASLAEAKELYEAGAISGARYTQVVRQLNGAAAADAGVGAIGKSAQESAAVFSSAFAQMEQRAQALRMSIDPAYAAQVRFDREIGNARELIQAGAISLDDYVAVLRRERAALNDSAEGLRRHGTALAAIAPQAQDFFTQISMGANPLSVLAIQGGQAAGQMLYLEGAAGKFAQFMMGPWGLAITAGLLILGALTNELFKSAGADDTKKKAAEELKQAIDSLYDSTLRQVQGEQAQRNATLETAKALLSKAVATRQAVAAELSAQADRTKAALVTERYNPYGIPGQGGAVQQQKLADQQKLAAAAEDQERKARDALANIQIVDANARVAASIDKRTDAEQRHSSAVNDLAESYRKGSITLSEYEAQKRKLDVGYNDEIDKLTKRREHVDRHAIALARDASAMQANASAGLVLAQAYLQGGDAALKAEAARKGLTDATRKGIDADAQTARQLQIVVADQLVNSARSLDQLRAETLARHAANDNVAAGTLAVADLNQRLSDEAALRPLLVLQTVAQGDALKVLTETIAKYRQVLADAHAEEARGAALTATDAAKRRTDDLRAQIGDLSKSPRDQAIAAAGRAATAEADAGKFTGIDRQNFLDQRKAEALAQFDLQRAQSVDQRKRSQEDSLVLAQRELTLVGASDAVRGSEMGKLQLSLDLKRMGLTEQDAEYQNLLRNQLALDQINRELERERGNWDEIRQTGGRFIDDVLNTDNWKNWGDFGQKVLKDLMNDFIRLAAINPLKNALFGENLPTASGVLGRLFGSKGDFASGVGNDPLGLGGLGIRAGEDPRAGLGIDPWSAFGSGGGTLGAIGAGAGILKSVFSIFGNAVGTENWSGGMMLAGENGPEILYAPRGTRVGNAPETRRALSAANEGDMGVLRVELSLSDDLNARIDDRAANVSVQVVRESAPALIDASTSATVAQLSRRRL
jgi:hypothetical protein